MSIKDPMLRVKRSVERVEKDATQILNEFRIARQREATNKSLYNKSTSN
jgi:hypothetical protein